MEFQRLFYTFPKLTLIPTPSYLTLLKRNLSIPKKSNLFSKKKKSEIQKQNIISARSIMKPRDTFEAIGDFPKFESALHNFFPRNRGVSMRLGFM